MSTVLDNALLIKDNINNFIVKVLSHQLDSFSIEENIYETGCVITCYYKTPRDKIHYISANYLYNSPHITMKCSTNPSTLREFYLFFRCEQENDRLHVVKDAISQILDDCQVGAVHMKFSAQPMGELHQDKKRKLKYFIHKEFLQGKISFEQYLNKFSFRNARLKSLPYYYLEDGVFKCNKVITFILDWKTISVDLKNDDDFESQVEKMCKDIGDVISECSVKTICKRFDIDVEAANTFSTQSVKDYISLMRMESI